MSKTATRVWEITAPDSFVELHLKDHSGLDAISCQLPEGFFTTFRTFAGGTRVLGLKAHLARLYVPARDIGIKPACDQEALRRILNRLLEPLRPGELRLRLALDGAGGRIFLACQPLTQPQPEVYARGVGVVTTQAQRDMPLLKKTAFISESQTERQSLRRSEAYEGLIVKNGRILEGLTSNFFYIMGAALGTAGRGVLRGVTRAEILRLARQEFLLPVRYRALRLEQVPNIQEAFLCSSSRGIVPVVQVDAVRVASGGVGSLTRRLMEAYQRSVSRRAEAIW